MIRSSFSQHNMFNICPKTWYWQYILKVPAHSNWMWANAGTVVHQVLEDWYMKKISTIEEAKEVFLKGWKEYNLDATALFTKKDDYWLMCVRGINLKLHVTTCEMNISYPEYRGFLDVVDEDNDIIIDWKSSTRSEQNEEEYIHQLKTYAYFYHKKFGKLPNKLMVKYLKYDGSQQELSHIPTEDDLKEIEEWYYGTLEKMQYYIDHPDELPDWNYDYHWCPYKNHWTDGTKIKFTLVIKGAMFFIDGPLNDIITKQLENKFSYEVKNAHFMKQRNPYAQTEVKFYNSKDRLMPLGFMKGVKKTLNDYAEHFKKELEIEIIDERVFNNNFIKMPEKLLNIELRPYQIEAANKIINDKIGILELGTGAGKTEIAAEVIRKLGVMTLFVVDKLELLNQTRARFQKRLGIEIGKIGESESIIKPVTIATVQTLNKSLESNAEYLADIRCVIYDECHKAAADTYMRLNQFIYNAEYKIGLSGTAYRDDGHDMKITSVVGDVSYAVTAEDLIRMGYLVNPEVYFISNYMTDHEIMKKELLSKSGLINETLDYGDYYEHFIYKNDKRNDIIKKLIDTNQGKKILIVSKLIDHGVMLQDMIPGSEHLHGSTPTKQRKQIMDDFDKGKINILISTISIFAEGIDIPTLDMVINVAANKGSVKTIQLLGRVLRKSSNKDKKAKYYDFVDESKYFRNASYFRKTALRDEGHTIKEVRYDEL